ncbi:ABC transporter permease [candidate division KSB1 bacterium]
MKTPEKKTRLTKIADKLISRAYPSHKKETMLGDLDEGFQLHAQEKGKLRAKLWYLIQLVLVLLSSLYNSFYWGWPMIKNNLKIMYRNIQRNRVFSIINIFGLSVGFMCTILLYLFISDELSYDKFHKKLDSIYRLTSIFHNPDGSMRNISATVVLPHGPAMKEYFPEVKECVRIQSREFTFKYEKILENISVLNADEAFFEVFSFPLISGSPSTVLSQLNSVVFSAETAKQYFGNEDPTGKIITLIQSDYSQDFIVTGIAEETPPNSTISFNMVINFECQKLFGRRNALQQWWSWSSSMQTFIEIENGKSEQTVLDRYPGFAETYYSAAFERFKNNQFSPFSETDSTIAPMSFGLQRMQDMHLDRRASGSADLNSILILGGIALLILAVASINFVTLSIGNSTRRSTEVGIRKAVGADRKNLVRQFIMESICLTGIASLIGIIMAAILLPTFNTFSQKSLQITSIFSLFNVFVLATIVIIAGVIVGCYPALVMAAFRPAEILKGKVKLERNRFFTKSLITFQFVSAVFLLISTYFMGEQIKYMINIDHGFNKENVIIINTYNRPVNITDRLNKKIIERLSGQSGIINLCGTSTTFDRNNNTDIFIYDENQYDYSKLRIDYNYFKTLDIGFKEGRDFRPEMASDRNAVIVNETLVKKLGLTEPIGKELEVYYGGNASNASIIGVVEDSHVQKLDTIILPAIYFIEQTIGLKFIIVKTASNQLSDVLSVIKTVWNDVDPERPLQYSFLDDDIQNEYLEEKRWSSIVRFSSLLSIFIACMGMFGLSLITVTNRFKEIGIRKVHGASVCGIIALLSRDTLKWAVIANVIAWPAGYFAMAYWLQNFAYKIDISLSMFIPPAVITLAVVFFSTLYYTLKAAYANPVKILRYE